MTYFFSSETSAQSGFDLEISAGNTSDISTFGPLKFRNMVQNRPKILNFWSQICCRQKFLTAPKFFLKNMTLQLHFALRIKVVAQKVANLSQIEVCGF